MRPLRVALVVKPSPSTREREGRNMGWWSYTVPEFTWDHFVYEGFQADANGMVGYDLIFQEDGGPLGFANRKPPLVYLAVDSTLSDAHYQTRLERARQADLILVDHDRLERFAGIGKPIRRWAYCVNDQLFRPLEKSLDVVFHCSAGARSGQPGGVERARLRSRLHDVCQQAGWSYRSGAVGIGLYAEDMGRGRVVVNWPRTMLNRPHRVFDAMASGACLLTGEIPIVDGDDVVENVHYAVFRSNKELDDWLSRLLQDETWRQFARNGHDLVMRKHTWAVRARELRQILSEELGL